MDGEGKGKGRVIRREREEGSEREENRKGRVKGKLKNGRVVKKIKVVLTLHNPVKGTMKKSQSHLVLMEGRIDGQINQLRMVPNIFEKKGICDAMSLCIIVCLLFLIYMTVLNILIDKTCLLDILKSTKTIPIKDNMFPCGDTCLK